MKKLFFCIAIASSSTMVFAQRIAEKHEVKIQPATPSLSAYKGYNSPFAKTTGDGDTLALSNISATDTLTYYSVAPDSGYITGTNAFGDMGFAELYDINGADSNVQVIGVVSTFGGTVNPASTKTVNFKVWDQGAQTMLTPTIFLSGLPQNVLDSVQIPLTQLGISPSYDTTKAFFFANPTAAISNSFFVGYNINYSYAALNGDTIALLCTINGERTSPLYNVSGTDTIINVQNATQYSDNSWNDNATANFFLYDNLAIYPIVVIHYATDVKAVTNRGLSFYGNYPNPASDNTNIQFSLSNNADVTIQLIDLGGHVINTIQQNNLTSGTHVVPVSTSGLAAGNYIYTLHSSNGGAIASMLSIVR